MPARQSIESPIVSAPAIETVQPEPVARALPEAPLAQEKSSSWWDDLSDSVSSAFDSSQPATEISQPLQAPETRAPLETPKSSANININTADAAEVDAPAVIDASKFAKEEVDKDAIVDVFSLPAEEQAAEKSTSWWDDVTDSVVGVFDSSEGQPDQAEVNKSAAMAESEPMLSTELAVPPATNDLPVPPSVSVASQAPDAAVVEAPKELPKNAASYDGLEIAEGFAAHSDFGSNTATLGVPPMAAMPVSPAPVITLPVPTVDENGDEILAQASDGDGSVGLKDPFQSGARLAPEPPAAPIKPIVPADTTAPAPVALKPKDPVVLQSAENQAVAAAVPTGKEEGTSWIGDMQDSLTSYFSEDAKKPVEPQAPLVSKDDALKVDELKAMPKEVVAKSDADTMKSMVGLNDLKPMPENPAAPAPANAPEPTPVVSKSAEKPAPKPAKASAEPRVSKAQAAPVGKVEEIIVPQPPVENKLADGKSDEIKPVAPVTQPNKTAQNTMDATVKTDASVVEKKAEPVPPAAMAEAKPVEAKPTEIAPKAETPVVPTVSAKSNESKPVVSAPPQQAPEVTVSAKAEKTVGAEKAPVTAVAAVQTPPVSTPAPTPVAVKPEEKVMASLAPDAKPAVEAKTSSATFSFVVGKSELSKESQAQLNDIAVKLKQGQNARVNVKAYATSGGGKDAGDGEVMAKRISLARGLAIRAYLIDQGVSALRINVQPLGNNSGGGNPERVDVEMTLPSGT
jgi:outer membrane protein OmpA-like peptidoglycan-associated protein